MNDFHDKFKIRELSIVENKHWVWSLRPEQTTLGSGILYLKSHKMNFSDLTIEEMISLKEIVVAVESILSEAFAYDKLNYLMLMMVDNCVHIHIIPRYQKSRTWRDRIFEDFDYPKPPILNKYNEFDDKELKQLAQDLKEFKV